MRRRYEVEVEMDVDPIEEAQPSASEVAKWVTDRLRGAHCDVMERPLCVASFIEVSPNMTLNAARAKSRRAVTESGDAGLTVEAAEPCAPASLLGTPQAEWNAQDHANNLALLMRDDSERWFPQWHDGSTGMPLTVAYALGLAGEVGEVANVVCGNLLPDLAGREAVFHLSAPEPIDVTDAAWCARPAVSALSASLGIDGGRADVALHLDPATPLRSPS